MSKLVNVWVFNDNVERYAELVASTRLWGEQVHLIVQDNGQANQVRPLGANEIVVFEATSGLQHAEDPTKATAAPIQEHTGLLPMLATKRAKSLGARLDIQLSVAVVNNAMLVTFDDDSLFAEHRMYGGLAFGRGKIKTTQAITTLVPGVLEPIGANALHTYPIVFAPYIAPCHEVTCQECCAESVSNVDLSETKCVVGVGRGLVAQSDLEMVRQLVSVLGAEVGCLRPIAEDKSWMERERYISVSGVLPKSDLYLILGILGQIRHMVGGNGVKAIVTISKDRKVPIFSYAGYGLVDDICKVVPAPIEYLSR